MMLYTWLSFTLFTWRCIEGMLLFHFVRCHARLRYDFVLSCCVMKLCNARIPLLCNITLDTRLQCVSVLVYKYIV